MHKFTYPLSINIGRKSSARCRLDALQMKYCIRALRTRLREENFQIDTIFKNIDTAHYLAEPKGLYTSTVFLPDDEAKAFLLDVCNFMCRRARLLTSSTKLLLVDEQLSLESELAAGDRSAGGGAADGAAIEREGVRHG